MTFFARHLHLVLATDLLPKDNGHTEPLNVHLDVLFRHRMGERSLKAVLMSAQAPGQSMLPLTNLWDDWMASRARRRVRPRGTTLAIRTTVDIAFGSCFDLIVMGSNRAKSLLRRHRDLPNSVFEAVYGR
jgi:hypothetical protein